MKRAYILIITLTLLTFGSGFWLDHWQKETAERYAHQLWQIRQDAASGRMEAAAREQAYVHALWQHDVRWLNYLVDQQHTRNAANAMTRLSTALEQGWQKEALMALDDLLGAFWEICPGADMG